MEKKELEKLLKTKGRKYVLTLYINNLINLTEKQLNEVINEKK